jgi:hypothetical protein
MQTGSIGTQDNWARFMQLSSQARIRNQGLSGSASLRPQAAAGSVATVAASKTMPGTASLRPMQSAATPYTGNMRPAVETRIVGGRFDAYA